LIDVADKPLLNHILNRFDNVPQLTEVIVVTNNKFYSTFEEWSKEQEGLPYTIKIVNDGTNTNDDRLGSIGDIDFVLKNVDVDDDLLVVGGDNLFDFNLKDYIDFAESKNDCVSIGVYDIGKIEEATKFGVVAKDDDGKITSFEEKPEQPKSSLIAMCFYFLPKATLGLLDKYLKESGKSDKAGDYIKWLYQQNDVFAFKFEGKWYDIGSVESYNEAREKFK